MKIAFSEQAWSEYQDWLELDPRGLKRLNKLIESVCRDPYSGIGKPEQLRHNWSGWWSRRIDSEHRLVYRIEDGFLVIAQCRFHYD